MAAVNQGQPRVAAAADAPYRVLFCCPVLGFDPTEAALPWQALVDGVPGVHFTVATPLGGAPAAADPVTVDGRGLGLLKFSLRAPKPGATAYSRMLAAGVLSAPISVAAAAAAAADGRYDLLLLPGGHCPDMIPYLECPELQQLVRDFHASGRLVAGVCHGVVVMARAGVLEGRTATTLPTWMESLGHNLTRLWMGGYYKTYADRTTEGEVRAALGPRGKFLPGPRSLAHDGPSALSKGFVVEDGTLITARWPGDCHAFGQVLVKRLLALPPRIASGVAPKL